MTRENKRNSRKPWNKHKSEYDRESDQHGRDAGPERPRVKNIGQAIRFGDFLNNYSGDDESSDMDDEEE